MSAEIRRLLDLAAIRARAHHDTIGGVTSKLWNRHDPQFETCHHPDCALVRQIAAELAVPALPPECPDEELTPHTFNSRTPYEPGDDRDIWCQDCEYHRDHQIHSGVPKGAPALPPHSQENQDDDDLARGPSEVLDSTTGSPRTPQPDRSQPWPERNVVRDADGIKYGTLGVPLARRREPTEQDFADPRFEVIWELIKRVDVDYRNGLFSGATGNDVCAVLDALDAFSPMQGPGAVSDEEFAVDPVAAERPPEAIRAGSDTRQTQSAVDVTVIPTSPEWRDHITQQFELGRRGADDAPTEDATEPLRTKP